MGRLYRHHTKAARGTHHQMLGGELALGGTIVEGGSRHGLMKVRCTNGDLLEATMVDGMFQGPATKRYADGAVLKATVEAGTFQGAAMMRFVTGDVLEGTMVGSKWHGPATHRFATGDVLEGTMVEGTWQGPANKTFATGEVIQGAMGGGKWQGVTTHWFVGGDVLKGRMVGGKWRGVVEYRFACGVILRGTLFNKHGAIPSHEADTMPTRPRASTAAEAPLEFCCPITVDVMVDPVLASDGHTYERDALRRWRQRDVRSPITREVLDAAVVPNRALLSCIRQWHV